MPLKVTGAVDKPAKICVPAIADTGLAMVMGPVAPVFPCPSLAGVARTVVLELQVMVPVPKDLLLLKLRPAEVAKRVPPV